MARLTEEMVIARSKQSDLSAIKKLNCWGAELGDVTLLRRMPNVEVLALSINKIRTLDDFAGCRRLRELYVRKNEIRSLAEIRHLRHLPDLTSLWLEENPCTQHPEYRLTVVRNLPHLEKLDNVPVHAEERAEASRRGHRIPDSDDEGYPQQETIGPYRRVRSCDSSPDRDNYQHTAHEGSDGSEPGLEPALDVTSADATQMQSEVSPGRRVLAASPDTDERYEHPAMTRSVYDPRSGPRSPDASLRHSFSAQSVKDYSYSSNGECRFNSGGGATSGSGGGSGGGGVTSPHYHEPYYDKPERSESYQQVPQQWEQERGVRERDSTREYPSAVMAEHRGGFTRRPVARNSNLLSAVLCLVKELDYPSLEVAEMAVRSQVAGRGSRVAGRMSPSSSGSWGGGGGAGRGGDIIDLDRYMRGHVRASRSSSEQGQQCEQLVVDAGGIGRKPVSDVRYKHYSHDSGLSDGSYDQRRSYRPRRVSNSDGRFRAPREQLSARTFNGQGHSDSLRAFRTVCEQALLDQQKQIARVTQLCEQLTERADERIAERNERGSEGLSGRENERTRAERREDKKTSEKISSDRAKRPEPVLSDTSDISSSSRSTKDLRRKEKHRTQECKTYKIIMSKLDELNRRFVSSRAAASAAPAASGSVSVSDVSVCDKLVATDSHRVPKIQFRSGERASRVVAQAYRVDIAPREVTVTPPNVTTEMVKCESSSGSKSSAGDPRCHFDLEDPVHLYSQAKRLQALNASIRRGRSHSSTESRTNACEPSIRGTAARASIRGTAARASRARERSPSICSVCRGYWRSLRQCLVAPFAQDCKCS